MCLCLASSNSDDMVSMHVHIYLVRVTTDVTIYDKIGQHLICHRVNFIFHHTQDVKPARALMTCHWR